MPREGSGCAKKPGPRENSTARACRNCDETQVPAGVRATQRFHPSDLRFTLRRVPTSLNTWQMLGLILISALFWMQYVQLKDRLQPEPRWRLLLAVALGACACGISVLGFMALDTLGVPDIQFGNGRWTWFYCLVFVGPLEEGVKVLMAYLFIFRWREFDEPIDGFVYAAAISLGFASVENFYNVTGLAWQFQLARTVALPITHILFSAIWGFGIGYARFRLPPSTRRSLWQIGSVVLAMLVHGFYDFLILAYQATLVSSGVALALWAFVIWRARALMKQHATVRALAMTDERPPPEP